jgi:hypothetical protein
MTSKKQEVALGLVVLVLVLPITVLIFYHYGAIHDLQSVIDQIIAGALAATAFAAILLSVHGLTKKKKDEKITKPDFNSFVEARLFFPSNIKRSERDLNHIPHKKLVLVKDSRKAYYVGEYALNLIKMRKIEWFAEDEQDLNDWCKTNGYTQIPENGDKDKLLERFFEAEIVNARPEYHLGESVNFRTRYRGNLKKGFFHNTITRIDGQPFPSGILQRMKTCEYVYPENTLSWWAKWKKFPFQPLGKLNGYNTFEAKFYWKIPRKAPLGQYRIFMRVMTVDPKVSPTEEREALITLG